MKTKVSKKISSLVLAFAIALTSVVATSVPAEAATKSSVIKGSALKAATNYTDLLLEQDTASAGVAKSYTFEVPTAGTVYFDIAVPEKIGFQVMVSKSGTSVLDEYVSSTDSYWEYDEGAWWNGFYGPLSEGEYTLSLTFDTTTAFVAGVYEENTAAKISQEKATITVGFTKKLSVSNGKVKSWSSSKKSVATVDKNGKVTAKKAGSATITAKLEDGSSLKCKVTVKANKYTASALTVSDVNPGNSAMRAHSVAYDSKGNLVIKVKYVNRVGRKVVQLKNLKITVKDANGKTVGTYSVSKKNVSVPNNSVKSYTFTIAKSKLKNKKAELRGGSVSTSGTAMYYY